MQFSVKKKDSMALSFTEYRLIAALRDMDKLKPLSSSGGGGRRGGSWKQRNTVIMAVMDKIVLKEGQLSRVSAIFCNMRTSLTCLDTLLRR